MYRAATYLTVAAIGAFLALVLMPAFRAVARGLRMESFVNRRTSHTGVVPETGGLAMALSSLILFCIGVHPALMAGAFVVSVMGMTDDCVDLPAGLKLLLEMAICAVYIWCVSGGLSIYAAVLWFAMLCVINAVNLIDGIDGLAAGICITALVALAVIFGDLALFSIVGVLAVFFVYSAFSCHSKVFLGDGGSLALGFIISGLVAEAARATAVAAPISSVDVLRAIVLIMAIVPVPLIDMARVVVVRLAAHQSPFAADRRHIHHLLVDRGLCHWQASLVVIAANMLCGCLVLATVFIFAD